MYRGIVTSVVRGVIAAASLSLLAGSTASAAPRQPDDPPQHIVEVAYPNIPNPLPQSYNGTKKGFYNVDFFMTVDKADMTVVHDMYWASGFYFSGNSKYGYMGLQVGAPGNTKIIFSIWGASIDSANTACVQGQEVGAVASCTMPYAWKVGTKYRFRIWATGNSKDASGNVDGEWWSAFILDTATNQEKFIARLKVPMDYNWIGVPQGFVEYYGALPDKCKTKVPATTAIYGEAKMNNGAFSGQPMPIPEDPNFAACAANLLVGTSRANGGKDLSISAGQ
jgi:hypothetical protein